ncbi:hypothetical protein MKQ70_22230 [Chitinophaga sedimenti]|uniref:hypothetical protein n=1 Tax=Chitinophaga sedimenti TaxID=2033606 RepID=UPI0020052115|nr:hypothetical protein [Chitinophaga sedimenti]MCK7557572.1 hypothetical protein [Chitinophaga sedimenti]
MNLSPLVADRVWQEILSGINQIMANGAKPQIILIPELHLPLNRVSNIKNISKRHNVMIISGIDFLLHPSLPNRIRNRGILTLPNSWGDLSLRSTQLTSFYFGKSYFTYMEREMFANLKHGKSSEFSEGNMLIFQSADIGNFGLMICSDIFDIERILLYQGRIHHLFIISLNKDLNSYLHMAEALARMIYCNVVICNTGFYGGSIVISPYQDSNERTIYRYQGQRMQNSQVVDLPVNQLDIAQAFDFANDKKQAGIIFKASPPGYSKKNAL